MIVVGLMREGARSPIDRAGRTPTPRPQEGPRMTRAMGMAVAALAAWAAGYLG